MSVEPILVHNGKTCIECKQIPVVGLLYDCVGCNEKDTQYYLCQFCFKKTLHSLGRAKTHYFVYYEPTYELPCQCKDKKCRKCNPKEQTYMCADTSGGGGLFGGDDY
jgi:hypothetical protein